MGAIVVDEHDRVLLVRRGHAPEAGAWSVPGGRVETGETVRRAVERELAEETGLAGECGELVGWVERVGPDHHHVILDFRVRLVGPAGTAATAGSDADAVAWVPLAELRPGGGAGTVAGSRRLVRGLAEFLLEHGVVPPAEAGEPPAVERPAVDPGGSG